MKPFLLHLGLSCLSSAAVTYGQILVGAGTYTQNFDTLATAGTTNPWVDNSTLPGWYASKSAGGAVVLTYRADGGSSFAGALYSYGTGTASDRALGSIASSTPGDLAFGVRFTNDTVVTVTNVQVSYTGEEWRNGGNGDTNSLAFAYRLGAALTNSDAANANTWTSAAALSFIAPTISTNATALDGNAVANRQMFASISLAVSLAPGQEIILRWFDNNDTGNDYGLAVDDLTVVFSSTTDSASAPVITLQPQSQSVSAGDNVTFNAAATGQPAPTFQWQWFGTNLPGQIGNALALSNVTTNQAGPYRVVAINSAGSTNSSTATLTVGPAPLAVTAFSLLTYNTHGNFVTNWTTNSAQVQAIGRQVQHLNPDVITFQEIPLNNDGWTNMGEFVAAFRPGYYLATNSGTDGFIRSAILSRYPITRSKSWLGHADLNPFGYTNSNFTRDLFEAQITVPGFPQPLHVFTVHLKSGQGTDDSNRRTAEAGCISNYFATGFLTTNSLHPYVLTGDMNEDINDPPASNPQSIQKLISTPTGLRLTTPVNPFTSSRFTFSIQGGLSIRYDYIMPNSLLLSNVASSQVFRTDLLPVPPPPLLASDSVTGSDHLPVLMVFSHPYAKPFKLSSVTRSNQTVTLQWESVLGQPYRVESSTNLAVWSVLATNLVATNSAGTFIYATNLSDPFRYFRIQRGL